MKNETATETNAKSSIANHDVSFIHLSLKNVTYAPLTKTFTGYASKRNNKAKVERKQVLQNISTEMSKKSPPNTATIIQKQHFSCKRYPHSHATE